MTKKIVNFSVLFLLLMTSVSSYCFCADEVAPNVISFQKGYSCCDSKQMSHCAANIDKACQTERENEFTVLSLNFQSNPEAILTSSLVFKLDSHQVEKLPLTAFQKAQESLFLKNEVLRI